MLFLLFHRSILILVDQGVFLNWLSVYHIPVGFPDSIFPSIWARDFVKKLYYDLVIVSISRGLLVFGWSCRNYYRLNSFVFLRLRPFLRFGLLILLFRSWTILFIFPWLITVSNVLLSFLFVVYAIILKGISCFLSIHLFLIESMCL